MLLTGPLSNLLCLGMVGWSDLDDGVVSTIFEYTLREEGAALRSQGATLRSCWWFVYRLISPFPKGVKLQVNQPLEVVVRGVRLAYPD